MAGRGQRRGGGYVLSPDAGRGGAAPSGRGDGGVRQAGGGRLPRREHRPGERAGEGGGGAGTLVVLESTVPVGATRRHFGKRLQIESGLRAGSFRLAYSPERVSSGSVFRDPATHPKGAGGGGAAGGGAEPAGQRRDGGVRGGPTGGGGEGRAHGQDGAHPRASVPGRRQGGGPLQRAAPGRGAEGPPRPRLRPRPALWGGRDSGVRAGGVRLAAGGARRRDGAAGDAPGVRDAGPRAREGLSRLPGRPRLLRPVARGGGGDALHRHRQAVGEEVLREVHSELFGFAQGKLREGFRTTR